ncbi:MAG: ImmA/IrrE family metallo-endopeptidase [Pseudonocardiaceae bacterium]
MRLQTDQIVTEFVRQHGGDDPEAVIRRLCEELLDEAGADIPVDMRMLASFRGVAEITAVSQTEAGCIFFDGERLVIRTRLEDLEERRRFTEGHEINHTFFPGFQEERRSRTDRSVGIFDRSAAEEYLCDVGAAELLLPRTEIIGRLPEPVDLDLVVELATTFRATVEATARRVAALCGGPTAVVVLEPGWRRAEEEQMRRRSFHTGLLDLETPPIPKKLRVRWAVSHGGMPTISRNKSVADNTPLAEVLDLGGVDYRGLTGLLPDEAIVSARHMPYRRDGVLIECVLVLLRGCAVHHA